MQEQRTNKYFDDHLIEIIPVRFDNGGTGGDRECGLLGEGSTGRAVGTAIAGQINEWRVNKGDGAGGLVGVAVTVVDGDGHDTITAVCFSRVFAVAVG